MKKKYYDINNLTNDVVEIVKSERETGRKIGQCSTKYKTGQVVETIDGIIGKIIWLSHPKVNKMSPRYEYVPVYKVETKRGVVFDVPEYEIRWAWFGVEI